MSRKTTVKATCPGCKEEFEITMWDSVNVDINPEEKARILDGSFFDQKCEHCGKVTKMFYPILYHDMSNKLMMWFMGKDSSTDEIYQTIEFAENQLDNFEEGGKYAYRMVSVPSELVEKALIFDKGLDDRVIEVVKLIVTVMTADNYPDENIEKIYFAVDKNNGEYMLVLYAESGNIIATNLEMTFYEAIANEYADAIERASEKKYIIDQRWAMGIFKE
ncbi:MAG: CpXC domain-containing protein [Acutalibacteraceae bacterium]|nr:CpXC domain-containing protein [Acutalibacteraceae bacterium]